MTDFTTKIKKIIAKYRLQGRMTDWRYLHAKTFDEGLKLFTDYLVERLKNLGRSDHDSPYHSDLTWEMRLCFWDLKTEFALFLGKYHVVSQSNYEFELTLSEALDLREAEINQELERLGVVNFGLKDLKNMLTTCIVPEVRVMKYPNTVISIEVLGDFVASVTFSKGGVKTVDFRDLPLLGAFRKINEDKDFFATIFVKDGYLMWGEDLTIDTDFVFEYGK